MHENYQNDILIPQDRGQSFPTKPTMMEIME